MRLPDGITTGLADQPDFPELARVVAAAFGDGNPKADPDVLRWQYDAPFGPTTVAVLRDKDRIVGQWAAIPYRAIIAGRPALVARTADAAILPSHRGRGLWPVLARTLFEVCADAGMRAAFSYPNDQSVDGLRQVGWTSLGEMRAHLLLTGDAWAAERLHVPVALARLVRRAAFRSRPTTVQASAIDGPPADADRLWDRVSSHLSHAVVRDLAWMQWRYVDRPGKQYRWWEVRGPGGSLRGLAVAAPRTIGTGTFVDLLELLAWDTDVAMALVTAVRQDLGSRVDGLVSGALAGSELSQRLVGTGFRSLPASFSGRPMRAGIVDTTGTSPALRTAPWALGWGDMDHL